MKLGIMLFIVIALMTGCSSSREGIYHTVEKGQTLYRISRAYGVDERYLARLNGIDDPSRLEAGQLVFIPKNSSVPLKPLSVNARPVPSPAPASSSLPNSPDSKATASTTSSVALAPKPVPKPKVPPALSRPVITQPAANPPTAAKVNQERFEKFIWPVRGKVLKEFGTSGLQTCQGVEIAVPGGTPILSALAGTVTYSGNGIRGYGNLIIVKHEGSFYTVYAFNKKNLVQPGAKVGKGERIALSGTHPVGGQNCLHFEIRRGKTAVNPILYLP